MNTIVWRLVDVDTKESDPEFDTGTFSMEGDGKPFCVSVSALKGSTAEEYLGALRSAVAFYYQAAHGVLPLGAQEIKLNG